jgi:hypothetical protein
VTVTKTVRPPLIDVKVWTFVLDREPETSVWRVESAGDDVLPGRPSELVARYELSQEGTSREPIESITTKRGIVN